MNYGYPPAPAGSYIHLEPYLPYMEQKPSTSGMPFQQVYSNQPQMYQPPRHPAVNAMRQYHMNDWLSQNPAFGYQNGYYNPSPAPSVHSLGSVNSAMSRCTINTQLTINTNFTQYSYHSAYMQSGVENVYPRKFTPWTAKDVTDTAIECIDLLNKYKPWETKAKEAMFKLQFLVIKSRPEEQDYKPTDPFPLDCLDNPHFKDLLSAMFQSMEMDDNTMETIEPANRLIWERWVSAMLVRILKIQVHYAQPATNGEPRNPERFEHAFDSYKKSLFIIGYLLQPGKEYSKHAVTLLRSLLVNSRKEKEDKGIRRRKRIQTVCRDASFIRRLVKIVAPDQEYLNNMERQLALDILKCILLTSVSREYFLNTHVVPEMLKRYFKLDGDEPVLQKIPLLLCKLASAGVKEQNNVKQFFSQFESVNGYQMVAEMLSHGSPRVLNACLKLINVCYSQMDTFSNACGNLALASLKLVGSTDATLTQMAIHFVSNAIANNAEIKGLVTRANGVEIILSALRLEYHSIDSLPHKIIFELTCKIRKSGIIILEALLRKRDENIQNSGYSFNVEQEKALFQAVNYPFLPDIICNFFNQRIDEERSLLQKLLLTIWNTCDAPTRRNILTKQVQLDDTKKITSVAESIVGCFFTFIIYFDNTAVNFPKEKNAKIMHIWEIMKHIYFLCCMEGGRDAILNYIGRTEPPCHNMTSLFFATQDQEIHKQLLYFMYSLASIEDPVMQQLPTRWAKHERFDNLMDQMSVVPIGSSTVPQADQSKLYHAKRLREMARASPHPSPPTL